MPADPVNALVARTRALPAPARYAATVAIVAAVFALRRAADPILPDGQPLLLLYVAVLLAAALFDHGCGLLATALCALAADYLYLPPVGSVLVADARNVMALGLFAAVGAAMTLVVESLHRALAAVQRANAELARSEGARALLLREFRHRTRNDLGSLAALLHLRARTAPSEAAREGLREAAQHAMALARVHTLLAAADRADAGTVDTREFVLGLCGELEAAQSLEGLRPVALVAEAEAHALDAERAVQLGLVLNEAVTNALKYGFPDGRGGTVRVRFAREGGEFALTVSDDGLGLPEEGEIAAAPAARPARGSGLGTRLLRALAAQLRGAFSRRPGEAGAGTVAELRFPAEPPGAAPPPLP